MGKSELEFYSRKFIIDFIEMGLIIEGVLEVRFIDIFLCVSVMEIEDIS